MAISALYWIAADGTTIDLLHGDGYRALELPVGVGMTPWRWEQLPSPEGHGALLTTAYAGVRTVDVPVLVYGPDFAARWAALAGALNPGGGDGTLRVVRSDGKVRDLVCRYVSGLERANRNAMDADEGGVILPDGTTAVGRWAVAPLSFQAAEPFWLGNAVTVTFSPDEQTVFFPILPVNLSPVGIYSSAKVENAGDVAAWPVWTIRGPGEALRLENVDTGEVFALDYTLLDGEAVTIDARPGRKVVTSSLGGDLWGRVTAWQMWAIGAGGATVRVSLGNTGDNTQVSLWYRPRYVAVGRG